MRADERPRETSCRLPHAAAAAEARPRCSPCDCACDRGGDDEALSPSPAPVQCVAASEKAEELKPNPKEAEKDIKEAEKERCGPCPLLQAHSLTNHLAPPSPDTQFSPRCWPDPGGWGT